MSEEKQPKWYTLVAKKHPKFVGAVQELGKIVRQDFFLTRTPGGYTVSIK